MPEQSKLANPAKRLKAISSALSSGNAEGPDHVSAGLNLNGAYYEEEESYLVGKTPNEAKLMIFTNLKVRDRRALARTCKKMYRLYDAHFTAQRSSRILSATPLEIHDMILSLLPKASLTSLAITCKKMWIKHKPQITGNNKLTRWETEEWLRVHARPGFAGPHTLYCAHCIKFHRHEQAAFEWQAVAFGGFAPNHVLAAYDSVWEPTVFLKIEFQQAHYVMSQFPSDFCYYTGPARGWSQRFNFIDYPQGDLRIRNRWDARIINAELYLHCLYHFVCESGRNDVFAAHLKSVLSVTVCKHIIFGEPSQVGYSQSSIRRVPHLEAEVSRPNRKYHRGKWDGYYEYCLTDYQVEIWRRNGPSSNRGLVVRVKTYHRLGNACSPIDPKWASAVMIGRYADDRILMRRKPEWGPGTVAAAWNAPFEPCPTPTPNLLSALAKRW